jgi:hypothetical protein
MRKLTARARRRATCRRATLMLAAIGLSVTGLYRLPPLQDLRQEDGPAPVVSQRPKANLGTLYETVLRVRGEAHCVGPAVESLGETCEAQVLRV